MRPLPPGGRARPATVATFREGAEPLEHIASQEQGSSPAQVEVLGEFRSNVDGDVSGSHARLSGQRRGAKLGIGGQSRLRQGSLGRLCPTNDLSIQASTEGGIREI